MVLQIQNLTFCVHVTQKQIKKSVDICVWLQRCSKKTSLKYIKSQYYS